MTLEDRQQALADFDAWMAKQEAAGWPSGKVRIAADRLQFVLWEVANNDPVYPTLIPMLARLTAEFEAARARAGAMILCPTCHALLDRMGYAPSELGLGA